MSVKELERQVRALPRRQMERFGQWFDDYREQAHSALGLNENWEEDLTAAQKQEILRRRAAYLADPSIATPWEGTTDRLIKQLRVRRRQKTSTRRS